MILKENMMLENHTLLEIQKKLGYGFVKEVGENTGSRILIYLLSKIRTMFYCLKSKMESAVFAEEFSKNGMEKKINFFVWIMTTKRQSFADYFVVGAI